MDEKEELQQEIKQELQWVKYRMKMLDIMERKLFEMKDLAQQTSIKDLNVEEREKIQSKIKSLESQVNALDSESRKE